MMYGTLSGILVSVVVLASSPAGGVHQARSATRAPASQTDSYQVPAGSPLMLHLRTPLDSGSNAVGDPIEAVLQSPVVQNGVELIPTGSLVFGAVSDVVRASARGPRAQVACDFAVVEHAETRSRATISTRPLVFLAPDPPKTSGRRRIFGPKVEPPQAAVPVRQPMIAVLSAPLLVRIPR